MKDFVLTVMMPALVLGLLPDPNPAVPLMTIWGETGVPEPSPAYPRPLLERSSDTWASLNGKWQLDRSPTNLNEPPFGTTLPEEILVPYPIESPLSGVRNLTEHGFAWYRLVSLSSALQPLTGQPLLRGARKGNSNTSSLRTLLHFEAADYNATVFVNGQFQGWHSGGYAPFSFDITEALLPRNNNNHADSPTSSSSCDSDSFPTEYNSVQCKGLAKQDDGGIASETDCVAACCAYSTDDECTLWQWCPEGSLECSPGTCWLGLASSSGDKDGFDCSSEGPEWVGGGGRDGGGSYVEVLVGVHDATSDDQATGKQRVSAFSDPGGVWYTPSSGLWGTVWVEQVQSAFPWFGDDVAAFGDPATSAVNMEVHQTATTTMTVVTTVVVARP